MDQIEQKYFNEGIDADTADFLLSPGALINGANVRFGSTDNGRIGYIESVPGTVAVPHNMGAGTKTVIHSITDENKGVTIKFVHDSAGNHGIYAYVHSTGLHLNVMLEAHVEGGLGFSLDHKINGCFIVGNLIYWNEGKNEPRKLNLGAAIEMLNAAGTTNPYQDKWAYTSPLFYHDMTIIKKPAVYPPYITKREDTAFKNNYIGNENFQFAVEYLYWDGEKSVLSPWTRSTKVNSKNEKFNKVEVTLGTERISQTVKIVRLIVKTDKGAYVTKVWDRTNATDLTAINNHNAGTDLLKFNFYNNNAGEFIDPFNVSKPFDSVPIITQTMELARNRIMMADNTVGYDTPTETSLQIALDAPVEIQNALTTTFSKPLYFLRFDTNTDGTGFEYWSWYVYLTEIAPAGYYAISSTESFTSNEPVPAPTNVLISELIYRGQSQTEVKNNIAAGRPAGPSFFLRPEPYQMANIVTYTTDTVYNIFNPGQRKAGIVFYDRYLRRCGVVTKDSIIITVPDSVTSRLRYFGLQWHLSATNQVNEIPEWAHHYAPVLTNNLRTRFFLSGYSNNVRYMRRDTTGKEDFSSKTWTTDTQAIAVDISSLLSSGMGYTFAEGDQINFSYGFFTETYTLPIIGQTGNYILIQAVDMATLSMPVSDITGVRMLYEIYTPYKAGIQEPYYEVGQFFAVLNPGTPSRSYSVIDGTFDPDAYTISKFFRSTPYLADAMSPNDKYYQRWDTNAGRANIQTSLGQVRNESGLMWSNKYLPGTSINGLSSFEALNEEILPIEAGRIVKLILASKVQQEGTVLLAICTNNTCSVYLGEAQISDSSGDNQFFVKTQGVIGAINILNGPLGTRHHKSVQRYTVNDVTRVLWFDVFKATLSMYSSNGLSSVSKVKMSRFFKKYSEKLLANPLTEQVIGGVDPANGEYLLTLPAVEASGFSGTLPTTTRPNEFDIYDGQAKTLCFKVEPGLWLPPYTFVPEHYDYYGMQLLGYKGGVMHKFNSPTAVDNNFFGTQHKTKLAFVSNMIPKGMKIYRTASVEANMAPTYTVFYTMQPWEQITDLVEEEWDEDEGIFYADIMRDRLSPNIVGTPEAKMKRGDEIRTQALKVFMEFTTTSKRLFFKFVNIGFSESTGHKT